MWPGLKKKIRAEFITLKKKKNAFKITFLISLDSPRNSKLPTQQINGISKENQSLLVNKVEISFFPKGPQSQPERKQGDENTFLPEMTSYFKKKQQPQKKERKNKVPPRRKLHVNSPKGDHEGEGWNTETSHEQTPLTLPSPPDSIRIWASRQRLCDWQKGVGVGEDPNKSKLVERSPPLPWKLWSLKFACFFRTLLVCNPGEPSNHKVLAIIFCNLSHALFKPRWDGFLLFLSCGW